MCWFVFSGFTVVTLIYWDLVHVSGLFSQVETSVDFVCFVAEQLGEHSNVTIKCRRSFKDVLSLKIKKYNIHLYFISTQYL